MAQGSLEHVNITVGDPDRTAAMLAALFDWQERWRGPSAFGGWTIHVGTDRDYIGLYTPADSDGSPRGYVKGVPLNHIGVVVEDLDEVERTAIGLGLKPFSHGNYEPGRRFYLFDADGIEWEIVSYN